MFLVALSKPTTFNHSNYIFIVNKWVIFIVRDGHACFFVCHRKCSLNSTYLMNKLYKKNREGKSYEYFSEDSYNRLIRKQVLWLLTPLKYLYSSTERFFKLIKKNFLEFLIEQTEGKKP